MGRSSLVSKLSVSLVAEKATGCMDGDRTAPHAGLNDGLTPAPTSARCDA